MHNNHTITIWMMSAAILASALVTTEGFAPIISRGHISSITQHHDGSSASAFSSTPSITNPLFNPKHHHAPATNMHRTTKLHMADNDNNGLGIKIFISGVLLYFVASAFAPLLLVASKPDATDLSLGDAVVTRQDGDKKMKSYQSKFDALSPAKVQEKLSNLPVFYLSSGDGGMGDSNFYLSFTEAESAAAKISSSSTVKVTTLDQVMNQLVLKRGTTTKPVAKKTPVEIKNAIENDGQLSSSSSYSLVPSTAALYGAKDMALKQDDIPLFVVERLAFAGNDGKPQVPLFTEKGDAITSYARLRESVGNKLPEEPSIRTTSLLDVLESMEKGTRPGVGQLTFYGNADDVLKADEMSQ